MTSKTEAIKEVTNISDYIKIKNFCISKNQHKQSDNTDVLGEIFAINIK